MTPKERAADTMLKLGDCGLALLNVETLKDQIEAAIAAHGSEVAERMLVAYRKDVKTMVLAERERCRKVAHSLMLEYKMKADEADADEDYETESRMQAIACGAELVRNHMDPELYSKKLPAESLEVLRERERCIAIALEAGHDENDLTIKRMRGVE